MNDVTAVSVNFRTPKWFETSVTTFMACYPDKPFIWIDNGGCDRSAKLIRDRAAGVPNVQAVLNTRNIGHGPALHQAAHMADTRFLFTLDSDTETRKCGFLERMLELFLQDEDLFAVGWLRWVNHNGVAHPKRTKHHSNVYIHPYAALYDLEKYHTLPPFAHRGAPAIEPMLAAAQEGYHFEDFPIQEYIWHRKSGTRGWFGGSWNPGTNRRKDANWNPRRI
ncbi:glycosyltransferase [bacterium]|nr:glycosyltransferase [bacterium]